MVGAVILGGDMVMGQVVEPLTFGHSTGLSPVAVILSTAFWAFMWGPIGLLLATPLTVCLVVIGRYVPALHFVHVMLSDASPLEPRETFYQRALEGNQAELLRQARTETARQNGATEYLDRVALGGLALAQADLARDALAFDRLEGIHAVIERLLRTLDAGTAGPAGADVPPGWAADGAVLCIPGRGQLDDLAATMAVQLLQGRGFGARLLPNAALGNKDADAAIDWAAVRMCCVSALEEGSSASLHPLLPAPHPAPRAGRPPPWSACGTRPRTAPPSPASAPRGTDEFIVLSLGELLALAPVIAARAQARTGRGRGRRVGAERTHAHHARSRRRAPAPAVAPRMDPLPLVLSRHHVWRVSPHPEPLVGRPGQVAARPHPRPCV